MTRSGGHKQASVLITVIVVIVPIATTFIIPFAASRVRVSATSRRVTTPPLHWRLVWVGDSPFAATRRRGGFGARPRRRIGATAIDDSLRQQRVVLVVAAF